MRGSNDGDGDGSSSSSSNWPVMSSSTSELSSSSSSSSTLLPRLISGSIGSIVTALAVTPLEVVKIRQQAAGASSTSSSPSTPFSSNHYSSPSSSSSLLFRGVKIGPSPTCPGCGTIILNNGLMDCVLPIESTMPLKSTTTTTTSITTSSSTTSSSTVPKSSSSGTIATLSSIFRNEGISGLYAGLRPTLVMSVPNTVLYFTAYDEISIRLRQYHANNLAARSSNTTEQQLLVDNAAAAAAADDANIPAHIPLVAGSTARLLATFATAPLELIRTRQASFGTTRNGTTASSSSSIVIPGMMEEFKLLTRTRGISSLYAGLAPTLWRDVPFSAFYWLFFERFRDALSNNSSSSSSSDTLLGRWGIGGGYYHERGMKLPPSIEAMHAFVAGAAAGSIAAAFTTPFDVVKTRQQMVGDGGGGQTGFNSSVMEGTEYCGRQSCVESSKGRPPPPPPPTSTTRNVGTFGYMQQIVQTEGISGLWKGNVTRMVKIAPACAIMISCYEVGKRVFEMQIINP